jgi:xanthine dehydrogenase accessory factor
VREAAARVWERGDAELLNYKLTHSLGMCCGGEMTFFLEPVTRRPTLVVLGCGHVGRALLAATAPLDFTRVAVDDLVENLADDAVQGASRTIASYEPADLDALPFGPECFVVIATREHALDQKLIEYCLKKPTAFLGVIGSARKALMQRERLLAKGFSAADCARVRCPVGVDVGAQTPEEIAIAICAELIQVRRAS